MHDLALRRIHDIIKAAAAVHAKSQWAVLILIPEGELHLIPVLFFPGASLDPLEIQVRTYFPEKFLHHGTFHRKLLLVGQILIGTAPAVFKMRTRRFNLSRSLFQHFQKSALASAGTGFCHRKTDFLARNRIFHHYRRALDLQDSLVRETELLYNTF